MGLPQRIDPYVSASSGNKSAAAGCRKAMASGRGAFSYSLSRPRDHAPPEAHRLFLGADASADRRVPQSAADAYWRPLSDASARSNSSRVA
jgi:hypothetical protein